MSSALATVLAVVIACMPAAASAQAAQPRPGALPGQLNPNPGTENYLLGVKTISPANAWSVGYYCTTKCGSNETDRGMILHWDGTAWSQAASPNPGTDDRLQAVTAVSPTDVWAAGYFFDANSSACGPLFEHWNGSAWSVVSSPVGATCDNVFGIYARAANDVWAVGYDHNTASGMGTLILHWDGSAWSQVPTPSPGSSYNILNAVSATSATSAWAAGFYCKSGCSAGTPVYAALILHWNGTTWSRATTPATSSSQVLNGIEAVSATNVWAVGGQGTGPSTTSLILHWNGTGWSTSPSPNAGELSQAAFGSPASGWALGGSPTLRWDGTKWSTYLSTSTPALARAISADGTNDIWAVGGYCSGAGCTTATPVYHILTVRWDGTSWTTVGQPTCPAALVVGLHGVSEGPSPTISKVSVTISDTFSAFKTAAALLHRRGESVDAYAYDTFPVSAFAAKDKKHLLLALNDLVKKVDQTALGLETQLKAISTACPSTSISLVGYSMGAWIVNDMLSSYTAEWPHIKAVVLYGDPCWRNKSGSYIGLARYEPDIGCMAAASYPLPVSKAPFRATSLCLTADPVCGEGLANIVDQLAGVQSCLKGKCQHFSYGDGFPEKGGAVNGGKYLAKYAF
jgi:hypothetical protein